MVAPVELSVQAQPASVPIARNFVASFAREADWLDEEAVERLRLATSELVTNAVAAQLRAAPDNEILIRCRISSRTLTVHVIDSAGGFDPPEEPAIPRPDLRQESGFGLAIVDALMDDVTFTRSGDGIDAVLTIRR